MATSVETTYGSYTAKLKNELVREPKNQWDQDMFLKILVAQMTHQDPMQPTSDTEFIGQMAQFSSLEQMTKLSSSMTSMQAYNLVGKYIYAEYVPDESTNQINIRGKVDSTFSHSGITYVVINAPRLDEDGNAVLDSDGKPKVDVYTIPLADVKEVFDPSLVEDSYSINLELLKKLDQIFKLLGGVDETNTDNTTGEDNTGDDEGDGGNTGDPDPVQG